MVLLLCWPSNQVFYIGLILLYFFYSNKFCFLQVAVIRSSLVSHNREIRDAVMVAQANTGSILDEMVHAQNMDKELKDWVTELESEKQQTAEEL